MEEEEREGEEDAGPCEVFGLLRLPLKPGTASGYVGVQRIASKKRPWQATLKPPGRKRLNVGCFKTSQEAVLARAQAKAEGSDIIPSQRKQAARSSAVKRSTAAVLSPLTIHNANETFSSSSTTTDVPLSAATALDSRIGSSANYSSPPFSADAVRRPHTQTT